MFFGGLKKRTFGLIDQHGHVQNKFYRLNYEIWNAQFFFVVGLTSFNAVLEDAS